MITLCLIVKNEQDNLKKCLSCVKSYVDEIVVVDTGSEDATKKIASEFTDKIYDFVWCRDFAKARNFAISKASNHWILVLDADENVISFDLECIKRFIKDEQTSQAVGRIKIKNIMDLSGESKDNIERINRFFNKNYFRYEGKIHEQIVSIDGKLFESKNIDIEVEHLGYTKEYLEKTNKLERNINLLKEAIDVNSEDPYLYYQLAKSYYLLRDYATSIYFFEKALSYNLNYKLQYVANLIETYGYALINSGEYGKALDIEKYNAYYNNADFYFLMGLVYMNNGLFSLSVEKFIGCTEFKSSNVSGLNSYLAYYNIGVIYEAVGNKNDAIKYYELCGTYKSALERIRILH